MKKTLAALFVLLCVSLLFFWPIFKGFLPFPGDLLVDTNPYRSLSILGYNPGAYPNKAQGEDVIAEMYPWRYFTISELKQGRIPLWNPHNFSGNIHMQNLQSSIFNPFNILFFLFPFTTGWTFFILLQPILGCFFLFFFARELRLSRFASMCGAIGFAFSSYMTVWIEYGNIAATFAYLPLLLFFLLRFFKKQSVVYYVGFIFSSVLMLLSGYIQGAFYAYCVCFAFTIIYLLQERKLITKKNILSLFAMFAFPIFLATLQLYSTYEVFSESTRWPYSLQQFQTMLQPIWYWITLFASDFFGNPASRNYYLPTTYIERVAYIGIPFLLFAVYSLSQKRRFTIFFAITAGLVALLTTNIPGVAYFYLLPIPVIDTTVPTRFLSVFMFCMVVLATFGVDAFFKKRVFPKKLFIIIGFFYSALWVGLFVIKKMLPQYAFQVSVSIHNLILPTGLVLATLLVFALAKRFAKLSQVLLFFIIVVDLFYIFQKITPFAPTQTVYPQTPVISYIQKNAGINRFWGYGSGYMQPNYQTIDGTYSPEGNDPLHSRNYGELLASSYTSGKLSAFPPRPDANVVPGFGTTGMENPYRQVLLNLLGVKYIVQHDELRPNNVPDTSTFSPNTYQLVWSQSPWQIYENKQVLPRYFLVNKYIVATKQQALNALYTKNLSQQVILNKKIPQVISPSSKGTVRLITYSPQYISFQTNTTGPMLLFLSDTDFPSWKAKVDGISTPIYIADYAFRAVSVPKGQHTVVMYYGASYFHVGLLISAVASIFFVLSMVVFIYAKKIEK